MQANVSKCMRLYTKYATRFRECISGMYLELEQEQQLEFQKTEISKTADCALCGQCITHCPTGALRERDDTDKLYRALEDKDTIVVAQIAPAVRAAWGESLGLSREEATVEKIVDALRRIGVDYVFDTTFFSRSYDHGRRNGILSRDLQMEILICIQCLHPVVQDGYVSSNLSIHRW